MRGSLSPADNLATRVSFDYNFIAFKCLNYSDICKIYTDRIRMTREIDLGTSVSPSVCMKSSLLGFEIWIPDVFLCSI